ncbi:unnamed protein product [Effrenium voratum]|nr:unnamed protein product [Effrenium voratum]
MPSPRPASRAFRALSARFPRASARFREDGVMRRSGKETPQQKRAKALLKLRAARVSEKLASAGDLAGDSGHKQLGLSEFKEWARPTEQIGGSVALPGGRRPGAQAVQSAGAGAVKAQNARSAGAGGEAALRAEDLLLETVELSPGEHSLLVLSSAGLFASGFSPQDVGNIAGACAPDAAKASQVLAEQAKDRLKEASKGEANWQKQEKAAASEVACVTALLCWGEGEEPQAKKPRTE